MDHVDLLLNISELNDMLDETTSVTEFLQHGVTIVARHFKANVCSIYLFDPVQNRVTLTATVGLRLEKGSNVSLALGEGLTGLAMLELRPIMTAHSSRHPNYKYFPGLHEEEFDAYLAVPVCRGKERIGVLVVQRESSRPFNSADQRSLRGVANQIAAMIDYSRLLLNGRIAAPAAPAVETPLPSFIKGTAGTSGWASGTVYRLLPRKPLHSLSDEPRAKSLTLHDFNAAIDKTIIDLSEYQKLIQIRMAEVASLIFASHILLLKDEQFTGKIRILIQEGARPLSALNSVADQYIDFFNKQDNPYFRQKADDIRDIAFRLADRLMQSAESSSGSTMEKRIVIAADLVPSDIVVLAAADAAGVILTSGGTTGHVSILARSLKLPLVFADRPELLALPAETTALIDADAGTIFINPSASVQAPYDQRRKAGITAPRLREIDPAVKTADGADITLLANINLLADTIDAKAVHARGIGLYRTEFPFLIRNAFPSEEEQFTIYQKLMDAMRGFPVTIRTLDIGGDKALAYYAGYVENNPFLGMRSIRFCLENRDIFKTQVRAILRAGLGSDLYLLFPMIASVDEFDEADSIVDECRQELERENIPCHPGPKRGVMIELPAAVELCGELAERADFFSLGTNDLVQYTLAVDRTNPKVSRYYCPHHPAVLRAIARVARCAQQAGKPISICGDMAHDPRYISFLIGIGIRTFSIDPVYFPSVRAAVQTIAVHAAAEKARRMLACGLIQEVERFLD